MVAWARSDHGIRYDRFRRKNSSRDWGADAGQGAPAVQADNAVPKTSLYDSVLVWGIGLTAAALLCVSTLEIAPFQRSLELRALVMCAGVLFAAIYFYRLVPGGKIDHENRRRVFFAVWAVHVLATLYFFPLADILNNRPVITLDHSFHYYQAYQVREVFWDTLRFDRYDPYFMAGYPGGTIFDLDMKGAELFCVISPIISVARALKLFILAAYLIIVPAVYGGSRMQGFKIEESMFGLFLFLAFWHWGRPYTGDFRYAGMFSFVFATHLCFVLVGLLRQVCRGTRIKTFLALGPLAFLVHPTTVVMLPVPFAVSIGADRRQWGGRKCILLLGWCAAVIFINIVWLEPFFKYVWMKTTTELYYQIEGWRGLVRLLWKPSCIIALSMIALAVVGVARTTVERRLKTALPAAAGSIFLFFVAGAGVSLPGINQLEPGRFLYGAFVFLTPLAGVGCRYLIDGVLALFRSDVFRRRAKTTVVTAMILVALPLSLLESKSYFRHTLKTKFRPAVASLVDEVTNRVEPPGRLMIEDCAAMQYGDVHLPALLPLITGVEQIGGPYPHTFLLYYFTSFRWEETFGRPMNEWSRESFRPYLDLYDVRWVVTASDRSTRVMGELMGRPPVWSQPPYAMWTVERARDEADSGAEPTNRYAAGSPVSAATEVRAGLNRIEISGGDGTTGYFIKYHWVPGLEVTGAARIRPVNLLDDPVPFIYIEPNGESDITIAY